jgi:tRNA(adenine34) deaminase
MIREHDSLTASKDEHFMRMALAEARKAGKRGEVPVGSIIVDAKGNILAAAGNTCIGASDPTGHAEMVAMRNAAQKIRNYRLLNTTIYVTVEPCVMCAGAMIHARIGRLVFGAPDPRRGAVNSTTHAFETQGLNHRVDIRGGVLEDECAGRLRAFFRARRA